MFSIHDQPYQLCDGISRREILRVGALGLSGLTLPGLLASAQASPNVKQDATFGRAKNIIYLFLAGGPPQHETFDPKPDAPARSPWTLPSHLRPTSPVSTSANSCLVPHALRRQAGRSALDGH